jgi:hypothetical protein
VEGVFDCVLNWGLNFDLAVGLAEISMGLLEHLNGNNFWLVIILIKHLIVVDLETVKLFPFLILGDEHGVE